MKKTMSTYQTGKFSYSYIRGNRYQMIIHSIDSNIIWLEPVKDIMEGDIRLGRTYALQQIKLCGIRPK